MVEDVAAEIDHVHDGVGEPFFRVVLESGSLDEGRLEECRRWGFNVADITMQENGVAVTFLFTGRPIN
ncbi:MAG: hypothetical protein M8354_06345 [Halalkalicoccus sp.]|nr:hypothetical protein [Halalkalicoccus sp.]